MGVENFKANFKGGYRPNKFKVIIPVLGQKLEFVCKGAQIPGRTMGLVEAKYLGLTIKYKGDPTFEEWSITSMIDVDFAVYNNIDAWMIAMDNIAGETGNIADLAQYKQTAVLQVLDGNDNVIQAYTLVGLFPTALQPVDVNWETVDTIAEVTCSFAYDYHFPLPLEGVQV
jgi:hypothetical protein